MAHPTWFLLFAAVAAVAGLLDGVSPQSWNLPGQRGGVWTRTLNGALAPMGVLIALGMIALALDYFTPLGRLHALFATLSGILLIGIAATSAFGLIAEYADRDPVPRPINIFASTTVGRFRFPGDFVPTPAAIGSFLLAFNSAEVSEGIAVFGSFLACFLIGAVLVALLERHNPGGKVQEPTRFVGFLFDYAPMFSNALLVVAASLLIHAGLEFDSFFAH